MIGAGVVLASVIIGLWLYVHDTGTVKTEAEPPRPQMPGTPQIAARLSRASRFPHDPDLEPSIPHATASSQSNEVGRQLRRLSNGDFPKITTEAIEKYLQEHGRDADSLLAAWSVSTSRDYLREAATRFPNDPRVQLEVLAHNAFPDDRDKWIALFKESSPDNPLANYLAAREMFRQNQTDQAIAEMLSADGKIGFADYIADSINGREQLYLASGVSPLEAKAVGMTGQMLPFLESLRTLSRDLAEAQAAYTSQGDTANSEKLASLGFELGQQLNVGNGGTLLINQLVGVAIETKVLSSLNPQQTYDWLVGTPAELLAELQKQRDEIKSLTQNWETALGQFSESDLLAYFDMVKSDGELAAMKWLAERLKSP